MDALRIIESVLVIVLALGGIIWGSIKVVQEKSTKATDDARAEVNDLKIEQEKKVKELSDYHDRKMDQFADRLAELDRWRKDMNGQLKLINERQQFTNQILNEQKTQIGLISESFKSVAISIAVLGESVKNLKSTIDKDNV